MQCERESIRFAQYRTIFEKILSFPTSLFRWCGWGLKFDWKIFFIRVDFSFGATLVSLVDFLRSHSLCRRSEGHLSSNFPLIAVENSLLFLIYFVRNDYRIRRIFFIYISRVDVVRGSLSQWFFRSSTAAFAFFCVSHDIRDIFQFIRARVHDVHDVSTFTSTSAVWDWFQCSFVTRFSAFSFSSVSLYFFSVVRRPSVRTKTAQCAHSEWALNFISCPFYHLARITFVCWRSPARFFRSFLF